ncbi:hypothetical protein [Faucicola boevrei]|uniref:hypothetical protein n=1 Tax=Faucicola boevrei TaxID=346665 RepID=UPI000363EE4C|nr:hypothetical protein [Moraxella boevrei]
MGLMADIHKNLDDFIPIGEVLLQISFQKQEPLFDIVEWLKFKHFELIKQPLYIKQEYDFIEVTGLGKDEVVEPLEKQELIKLFLENLSDLFSFGSVRSWVYSGKYESFSYLYGCDRPLKDCFYDYHMYQFKKQDLLQDDIFKVLEITEFYYPNNQLPQTVKDQQTQIDRLTAENTALQAKIAELESQHLASDNLPRVAGVTNIDNLILNFVEIQAVKGAYLKFYKDQTTAPKQLTVTDWITQNYSGINPSMAKWLDKILRQKYSK